MKTKDNQKADDLFFEQEEERLRVEAKEKERLEKLKQQQAKIDEGAAAD